MDRRGSSLGCVVASLGLVLSICLLPYLISSVYSVVATLLQQDAATKWLWGDWLSTIVNPRSDQYRLLAEAPICCVGVLALLILVLGLVWMLGGGERDEAYAFPEELESYSETEAEQA